MVVKVGLPKVTQCGFHHDEPELFVKSQWQRGEKSFLFLLFRWALAAFFIGTLAYSWTNVIRNEAFKFWFIYMTNWGLFLCTISTSLAAFLTTFYHFGCMKFESQSISYKVFWFLSSVSTVLAFVITIVYWSILFNGKTSTLDLLVHGGNSVAMMLELLMAGHPMFIFHFVYSINVGLIYLIFTIIYYFAGGLDPLGRHYIYNVIDWSRPGRAASVSLGVLILAIFLHIIMCLIQKLRHRLHKKCFKKNLVVINNPQNVV